MARMSLETFKTLVHDDFANGAVRDDIQNSIKLLDDLFAVATRFPRCCDLWQDGLGGMHCRECSQKTFAMMRDVQELIGVGKDGMEQASKTEGLEKQLAELKDLLREPVEDPTN